MVVFKQLFTLLKECCSIDSYFQLRLQAAVTLRSSCCRKWRLQRHRVAVTSLAIPKFSIFLLKMTSSATRPEEQFCCNRLDASGHFCWNNSKSRNQKVSEINFGSKAFGLDVLWSDEKLYLSIISLGEASKNILAQTKTFFSLSRIPRLRRWWSFPGLKAATSSSRRPTTSRNSSPSHKSFRQCSSSSNNTSQMINPKKTLFYLNIKLQRQNYRRQKWF